jgi:glycosyltransferase involved in cell wall biosynthesis
MKVTVITPTLNQAPYIQATLDSVRMQDYSDIEHVVMDGGSTDGTLDILQTWGGTWYSEPDAGQADAINKGVARTTGEIVTWLNSDDVYLKADVLSRVVELFEANAEVVSGGGWYLNEDGSRLRRFPVRPSRLSPGRIAVADYILQPATFYSRRLAEQLPLDVSLRFTFDWDLFIRLSRLARFVPLYEELVGYRLHAQGKTVAGGLQRRSELLQIIERYHGRNNFLYRRTALLTATWSAAEHLPPLPRRLVQRGLARSLRVMNRLTDGRAGPG